MVADILGIGPSSNLFQSLSLLLAASLRKLSERIHILLAVHVTSNDFGGIFGWSFICLQ
jgi:hypothetical protein